MSLRCPAQAWEKRAGEITHSHTLLKPDLKHHVISRCIVVQVSQRSRAAADLVDQPGKSKQENAVREILAGDIHRVIDKASTGL